MGEPGSSSADAAVVVENPVVAMVIAAEAAAAESAGGDVEAQQRPPSRQASSTQAMLARPSRSGVSLSLSLEGRAVSATRVGSNTSAAPAPAPCDGTTEDLGGSANSGSSLRQPLLPGWQRTGDEPSLAEANSSIKFPDAGAPWYKKLFAFSGLGFLVAVGYMDPGNWATGLAGGSKFGYTLLCIVLMSNIMAMFLQHLALKLGIAAERDLAQACRDAYNKWVNYFLWILAEIAIAATDLAEVIGTAIALNLLFGLPLWAGVIITAADALLLLLFEQRAFRLLELVVTIMTLAILVCFIYELVVVKPNWLKVLRGYVPSGSVVTNPEQLYIAIGILGATVMPHNLYLHSSVIQTRAYPRTTAGKRMAIKYGTIDSTLSLLMAFFINSSIVILAGTAFYYGNPPRRDVEDISEAYHILAPALGTQAASILFGVALLCSGQQSTITGTLAGQIVMEGFLNIKLKPFFRRLITRGIAIVPAATVAACMGAQGVNRLLVLSQVILSLQLSFAVVPLVHFTSSKAHMGEKFVNRWYVIVVAVLMTLVIAGLNVYLVVSAGKDGTLSQ